jgi:hypothetical protein
MAGFRAEMTSVKLSCRRPAFSRWVVAYKNEQVAGLSIPLDNECH